MTKSEFENLKFGDVVYKTNGQGWIFLNSYSDCSEDTKLNAVNQFGDIESIRFIDLSLTKPNKKVKKEIVAFLSDACISDLNSMRHSYNREISLIESSFMCNKVTITYETEE